MCVTICVRLLFSNKITDHSSKKNAEPATTVAESLYSFGKSKFFSGFLASDSFVVVFS